MELYFIVWKAEMQRLGTGELLAQRRTKACLHLIHLYSPLFTSIRLYSPLFTTKFTSVYLRSGRSCGTFGLLGHRL